MKRSTKEIKDTESRKPRQRKPRKKALYIEPAMFAEIEEFAKLHGLTVESFVMRALQRQLADERAQR